MIELMIGGVRSGKSDGAENRLIDHLNDNNSLIPAYIATSVAIGQETNARILRHQAARQSRFVNVPTTFEIDYAKSDLLSVLNTLDTPQHVILIECLSTWVGWYLSANNSLEDNLNIFAQQQTDLLSFLKNAKCSFIIVTGEVGCGLIGETPLQRRYADALGELNQKVAALSNQVFSFTAGIPQQLK